jgi:hypothetical protein
MNMSSLDSSTPEWLSLSDEMYDLLFKYVDLFINLSPFTMKGTACVKTYATFWRKNIDECYGRQPFDIKEKLRQLPGTKTCRLFS